MERLTTERAKPAYETSRLTVEDALHLQCSFRESVGKLRSLNSFCVLQVFLINLVSSFISSQFYCVTVLLRHSFISSQFYCVTVLLRHTFISSQFYFVSVLFRHRFIASQFYCVTVLLRHSFISPQFYFVSVLLC